MTDEPSDDRIAVLVGTGLPLIRSALVAALVDEPGFDVVADEGEGSALLAEARRASCGVVLVDARLPGLNGVEVCAAVRAEGLPLRVVVLSEDADRDVLLAAVESGADGYVFHDASLKELFEAIRRVHGGEAWVPSAMLGTLLSDLIRRQRAEDDLSQRFADLTKRERQIVALLVDGLDHQAIAEALVVSPHTARTHIQNVMEKLGVHSRLEVARLAVEHGLVTGSRSRRGGNP